MIFKEKNQKIVETMSTEEIERMFCNVTDEDIILLGFNPELIHPKNFIISVFPVLPPIARPFVLADGNICDDDLTNQILEIIKCPLFLMLLEGQMSWRNRCGTKGTICILPVWKLMPMDYSRIYPEVNYRLVMVWLI
jgi:hypothetical protein